MRKFGLIGYPLSHSFSMKFFTEKFQREHIADATYELFEIEKIGDLCSLIEAQQNLRGLNVTIPHKESVLPFCNELSATAAKVGAVNCLKIADKKITGFNTDVIGFENSLLPLLLPHHKKALILGSGGSSKAVWFVLQTLGIECKTVSRAAHKNHLRYDDLDEETMNEHLLIVHTTPLGMFPYTDEKPQLPYRFIHEKHLLFDLIYNPVETAFLRAGRQQGAATKNGWEMLQIQAEESWKIWNTP